jgi:hypothetical protein
LSVLIPVAAAISLLSPRQASGQWNRHVIDPSLDYAAGLAVEDMDGDGDLDVVASGYNDHRVLWYEAPSWTKHLIDHGLMDDYLRRPDDLDVGDINGDGTPDIVATSYELGDIVWYEAPSWTKHVIDVSSSGSQHVKITDVDGDTDLDVVATGRSAGDVRWYEAPSWARHDIDLDFAGGRGLHIADVNGDDVPDVLGAAIEANDVVWYEAPSWTKHVIDGDLGGAIAVSAADVDDDGGIDILAAGYNSNTVVLYRGPPWTREYRGPPWTREIIGSDLYGARSVSAADVDGDGDLDVVATGMISNRVVWYEAPSWEEHLVDSGLFGAYFMHVADIDGDEDLDVVSSGTESDEIVWCENTIGTGVGIEALSIPEVNLLYAIYPNPLDPRTTIPYDLPESMQVEIFVVNALGRRVATLVDGLQGAGRHSIVWPASSMPSGLYFVHLRTAQSAETAPLVIAR